jgi:predicted NAD/FAD-binding protein
VAIVGAGVTGLGAAYHLVTSGVDVEVLVYEPSEKAGGHANTVEVDGVPVDVGFMVYNHQNYPNMVELFEELGVEDEVSGLCGGLRALDSGSPTPGVPRYEKCRTCA